MIELFGIVFGGVSRLAQHWMDLKDKQKEREHEAVLFDKQVALADKRNTHDADMRRMDIAAAQTQGDISLMVSAIESQKAEAVAAGGWVLQLSASIRPVLTLYHAVFLYSAIKVALFVVATNGGLTWPQALLSIYGEFDRALVGSMVSFWFADRALRNAK